MQDTLLYMTQASIERFTKSIQSFIPLEIKVIDAFNVVNKFLTPEQEKEREED